VTTAAIENPRLMSALTAVIEAQIKNGAVIITAMVVSGRLKSEK
jgi:hypothetical protein